MSVESRLSTPEVLQTKNLIYHKIRNFFQTRNVIEVSTSPFRKSPPTDVFLDHFQCHAHNDDNVFYMHSSPEYAMKQLLMNGAGDMYQMCQVARGNESGSWHSNTFTMLEWYRLKLNFEQLISEVIDLMEILFNKDLSPIAISYQQSYAQAAKIPNIHQFDITKMRKYFLHAGIKFDETWAIIDFQSYLMTHVIEPYFNNHELLIIYDYPANQAALAKCCYDKNGNYVAKRFEVYCNGIEIGNGYQELTDYKEHIVRFENDQKQRLRENKPCYPIDNLFLNDLKEKSMPESVGIAMGVDRIIALIIGAKGLLP